MVEYTICARIDNATWRSVYLYVGYIMSKIAGDVIFDVLQIRLFTRNAAAVASVVNRKIYRQR